MKRKPIQRRKAEAKKRDTILKMPVTELESIEWEELESCNQAPHVPNWHNGATEQEWRAAAVALRLKAEAINAGFYAQSEEEAADDNQWEVDCLSTAVKIENFLAARTYALKMPPTDHRQTATILAALRYWQEYLSKGGQIPRHFDHFDDTTPLSVEEIDSLCMSINLQPAKVTA